MHFENNLDCNDLSRIMMIAMYLLILLILVVVSSSTLAVYAQGNITSTEELKFLAIQHAQSGSILQINDTTYSLELNNVSDKTILFSDRPDRIVIPISTDNFVGNWSVGENSFAVDAPNAVLVIDSAKGEQDTAMIELFNPTYDFEKTINYEITPDNATSIELPSEFGQSTLVIDRVKHPTQY
jgi:hypothetical protein